MKTREDLREYLYGCIAAIVIIGVIYWFIVGASLPSYDYVSKGKINGVEHCFHSDDGFYVQYYTRTFNIHSPQGHFINKNSTFDDDIKVIEGQLNFYENLKEE